MASISRHGKTGWQVRVRKKGLPLQVKTFKTKVVAQRWARQIETDMDNGVFVSTSEADNTTVGELLDRYVREVLPTKKSQRQVVSQCNIIRDELGSLSLTALTPTILAHYRDKRLECVSGHTVRKDLLLIRRVLIHAIKEWGFHLPRGNPVDSIKVPTQPKGRERRLEDGEEELLLDAAREYGGEIEGIVILAIETGMRRSEITSLKWEHLDLSKRIATLYDTKNGQDRTIPLTVKAYELLVNLPRNISGSVFTMLPDSITRAFVRICKRVEIVDLRFHDLRHEATSRFFEKGLSIMEVSSITGHKDLAMLKRYTHLRAEDLVGKIG